MRRPACSSSPVSSSMTMAWRTCCGGRRAGPRGSILRPSPCVTSRTRAGLSSSSAATTGSSSTTCATSCSRSFPRPTGGLPHPDLGPRPGSRARYATPCSRGRTRATALAADGPLEPSPRAARSTGTSGYRYHPLLANVLRAELRRTEPEVEAGLHSRASAWYEDHGDPDRAIEHAIDSGDVAQAGDLLWGHVPDFIPRGRLATVEGWLARFSDEEVRSHPSLAFVAAAVRLVTGDGNELRYWTACRERGAAARRLARAGGQARGRPGHPPGQRGRKWHGHDARRRRPRVRARTRGEPVARALSPVRGRGAPPRRRPCGSAASARGSGAAGRGRGARRPGPLPGPARARGDRRGGLGRGRSARRGGARAGRARGHRRVPDGSPRVRGVQSRPRPTRAHRGGHQGSPAVAGATARASATSFPGTRPRRASSWRAPPSGSATCPSPGRCSPRRRAPCATSRRCRSSTGG